VLPRRVITLLMEAFGLTVSVASYRGLQTLVTQLAGAGSIGFGLYLAMR